MNPGARHIPACLDPCSSALGGPPTTIHTSAGECQGNPSPAGYRAQKDSSELENGPNLYLFIFMYIKVILNFIFQLRFTFDIILYSFQMYETHFLNGNAACPRSPGG